uniref:Ubiquitin-like protease family profile domain-containing protein n=1 Tax=Oryza glumipatula TaxID=40148 RepID=A0A0E0A8N4_9ORYZ
MLNKNKMILGSLSNHHKEAYINPNVNTTCETKEDSNQCNQSSERLTGPTGRTYKPTTRTDFCDESRGKKDIIRTQTPTKITLGLCYFICAYAHVNGTNFPPFQVRTDTYELRGEKKRKQYNQTSKEISELYIEKEDLTKKNIHKSPSNNVMDAYIQCLRNKEKGAFLEQAIKICLLNVEGAHVESNNPRDKQWIRDMAPEYLPFYMIFLPINIKETHWYLAVLNTKRREVQILDSLAKPISEYRPDLSHVKDMKAFRQDLAGILIKSELNKIKDCPLLQTTI